MANLISVKEAQQRILSVFKPLDSTTVPLERALGRILAQDIAAQNDFPLFANSSMDGFAAIGADLTHASPQIPAQLAVIGDIPAGVMPRFALQPGQAARIMTGAPLPQGADCVVPVEQTDFATFQLQDQLPTAVSIFTAVKAGDFIRPRGQDLHSGQVVLQTGRKLRPQDVGMLAMLGVAQAPVHRVPRVALLSSGDEIIPVDQPLEPGKIHDANSYSLAAAIEQNGGEVIRLGVAADSLADVRLRLQQAQAAGVNLILTSAGVSVGAFDYVRAVIEEEGRLDFWRVNMRPGKPVAFGSFQGIPLIGLPGNPVSAFVTLQVFVIPALLKMAGLPAANRAYLRVRLAHAIESDGRESYLRAILRNQNGQITAELTGHQGSGNLYSLVQANALLIIPSGVKSLPANSEAEAWLLDENIQV